MFDYVIVGGGSAGCVLAGRLSEDPQVNVCLLEAGGPDSSVLIHCPAGLALLAQPLWPSYRQHNWAFETVPQAGLNGRRGYQPRGKTLGGSSSINAMIYMRGHSSDYDYWAAQGNPGWGWTDVLPFFKRAENNERGADAFHGTGGPLNVKDLPSPNPFSRAFVEAGRQAGHTLTPDFNGASTEGVGLYQVTHQNGERFSAAKAYLTPHLGRTNLKVVTHAHATSVLFEGTRACGVEARINGSLQRFDARREVLLAAGALQSPQLLMLSGVGPGADLQRLGLAVKADVPGVGQNLHDHVDVVQIVDVPKARDLFGLSPHGLGRVWGGVREWRATRSGLLTTNFAEGGAFLRTHSDEPVPDVQLHFVVGKLVDHGRQAMLGHGYSCHVCVLQPKSRGSVRLASADPLTAPLIDPAFLAERDDVDRLIRGFKLMRHVLQQPALAGLGGQELPVSARARSDQDIEHFIRQHADTIYHPVGTCRMGSGPNDVVDAQLHVRGTQALRVVDASVMPRIVSGNTNAPTMMIAEKAVELIRQTKRH